MTAASRAWGMVRFGRNGINTPLSKSANIGARGISYLFDPTPVTTPTNETFWPTVPVRSVQEQLASATYERRLVNYCLHGEELDVVLD